MERKAMDESAAHLKKKKKGGGYQRMIFSRVCYFNKLYWCILCFSVSFQDPWTIITLKLLSPNFSSFEQI